MKHEKLIEDLEKTILNKTIEIENKKKRKKYNYFNSFEHGIDVGYILLSKDVLKLLEETNCYDEK